MTRFLTWIRRGGEVTRLVIHNPEVKREDYSIVDRVEGQNELRHILAVLDRVKFPGSKMPVMPHLCDIIIIHEADGRYSLWVDTRNWSSRAGFLSGVLVGHYRPKRSRRRRPV